MHAIGNLSATVKHLADTYMGTSILDSWEIEGNKQRRRRGPVDINSFEKMAIHRRGPESTALRLSLLRQWAHRAGGLLRMLNHLMGCEGL